MQPGVASGLKVGLVSLGCAKNLVDSEVMLGLLQQHGFSVTPNAADADVILVNSCTFIEAATRESVESVLEMARFKQQGSCRALILAGCLGARYGDQLLVEMPELDAVIGTGEIAHIGSIVNRVLQGERFTMVGREPFIYDEKRCRVYEPTRLHSAYVKIAEGCNHKCAFCVIPRVRGAYRSRSLESVLAEAHQLVHSGAREIVVIAQDSTLYGQDLYGRRRLAELLDKLADTEGLQWLRVLYAFPTHLTDDILEVIARRSNICKYVELPLQHVSERVLRSMNRSGSRASYDRMVARIRGAIPGVVLRTSFIVGYPGETDEDFSELCDFIREQRFDHVGVFSYSQEEGTPAAALPMQIDDDTKEERRRTIMLMQKGISRQRNKNLLGSVQEVLVEQQGWRLARQAPEIDGVTRLQGRSTYHVGEFVQARIDQALDYDLVATVL